MRFKRTATFGVVGGALAAWLAAAGTSPLRVPPAPVRKARVEKSGAELATEIARLHERLRPAASPRSDGRNLFRFGASPAAAAASPAIDPSRVVHEAAALPPPPPPFTLAGIAEDAGPDGPIRTAIISTPRELFLARVGETIAGRYRVAAISADVVELVGAGTGETIRLALP
ncbi:MAG: hypothetical protein IT176_11965 [Acidobacteria bacterium]|nr:hypothetical protein [Acidobacteriota bacterium]